MTGEDSHQLDTINLLDIKSEVAPHTMIALRIDPVSSKMYKLEGAPIEELDQPVHPRSLTRTRLMGALCVAKGPTFLLTKD